MADDKKTMKTMDELLDAYRQQDREMRRLSSTIGKISEILSKSGVDKFTEELRKAAKQTKLFTDEELDHLKSLRRLTDAIDKTEDDFKKIREEQKKREKARKIADPIKRKNALKILRAEFEEEAKLRKASIKKALSVPQFDAAAKKIVQHTGKYDKLNKVMEDFTGSLKVKIGTVFTAAAALNKLSQSATIAYGQLNRLANKGILNAMWTINKFAATLGISQEEVIEMVNKNRDLVNVYGSGTKGIEQFLSEVGNVRKELVFLGKDAPRAAGRFIETTKKLGIVAGRDTDAYRKTIKEISGQFKEFSAIYGDNFEEYAGLIEAQAQEETFRRRLNNLSSKQIETEVREMLLRQHNLKLMGMSNMQIVEFNAKMENLFDPKKNTQVQRRTEAAFFNSKNSQMMSLLASNSMFSSELKGMQAAQGTAQKLSSFFATGRLDDAKNLLSSGEGRDFLQAQANAESAIARAVNEGKISDLSTYGINVSRERAGGFEDFISQISLAAQTAKQQGRDQMDNEKALRNNSSELTKLEVNLKALGLGTVDLTKEFGELTKAVEGLKTLFENPFAMAIGGAILAVGSMALSFFTFRSLLGKILKMGGIGKGASGGAGAAAGTAGKSLLSKIFAGVSGGAGAALSTWFAYDAYQDFKAGKISEKEFYSQLGGAIGGGVGAVGGAFFGPVGSIAAGAGLGIAGQKIGGLFGSDGATAGQTPAIANASPGGSITGMTETESRAYTDEVKRTESSRGNYSVENSLGFLGAYQMGAPALADAGLVDTIKTKTAIAKAGGLKKFNGALQKAFLNNPSNWLISGGKASFMKNPALQDEAFLKYTNRNIAEGMKKGVISSADGANKIMAFAKSAHISGATGAVDLFKNGVVRSDGAMTNLEYAKQGAAAAAAVAGGGAATAPALPSAPGGIDQALAELQAQTQLLRSVVANTARHLSGRWKPDAVSAANGQE